MSQGVPIAQRPDLKDASLSARLDAVFGSLGPGSGDGGWTLRQDIQPFRAGGGIEDYNYSSDEEDPNEGLKPLMPSRLVDSDDDDDNCDGTAPERVPALERADPDADAEEAGLGREQNEARAARERERMRATLSSRRAFEAEAEEDEFDRVATGTMDPRTRLIDARPPGFTEVPVDSAWERMHGRLQQRQQEELDCAIQEAGTGGCNAAAAAAEPTAMNSSPGLAGGGDAAVAVATSRKRFRTGAAGLTGTTQAGQQQQQQQSPVDADDVATGDVEMMPAVAEGGGADPDAPREATVVSGGRFAGIISDSTGGANLGLVPSGAGGAAAGAAAAEPPPLPRQRGGRRVQWADFVASTPSRRSGVVNSHATAVGRREANAEGSNGHAKTANGSGGGGGGGRIRLDWQRRGFVPDHVRNPHKYTMYTLDEELVVGGGERSSSGRNGGAPPGGRGWRSGGAREGQEEDEIRQALAQARRAVEASASDRVDHDPERPETTFGSGITFRPRAARQQEQQQQQQEQQQQQQATTDRPPRRQLDDAGGGNVALGGANQPPGAGGRRLGAAFIPGVDGGEEQFRDGEGVPGAGSAEVGAVQGGGGGSGGGGRRHFRARPRRADEDDDEGGGRATGGGDGDVNGVNGAAAVPDGDVMQQD